MKQKIEKITCEHCNKKFTVKKIHSLTWRYNDKEITYTSSKVKIIHTGRKYLCKKDLLKLLK